MEAIVREVIQGDLYSDWATGWTTQGSNPGRDKRCSPSPNPSGAHPASYLLGTGIFPCGTSI
jgi:hypothetical protein